MTNDTVAKTAKLLNQQREKWENGANKARDNELYALLGDCLDFYNDLEGNPEQIEKLKAHLEAQGINGNKGTSLGTLIVRAVFGKDKDKRTYSYAKTLTLAAKGKANDVSMHEFIVSRGGIEAIRRGKGNAKKAAVTRNANLSNAKRYFSTSSALGSPITVTNKGSDVNEGRLFVAIMREEADGGYSMVYETAKESLLNSAFTDASKGIPDGSGESDQPDAKETTAEGDKASPAVDPNATDGGTDIDSGIESDPVDVGQETEPQGDTTPDESPTGPVTQTGNLRAKTVHIELPLAVKERLAAMAA